MKIGINGRFLQAQQTGVQRTSLNLIRHLLILDSENEYILFTINKETRKLHGLVQYKNLEIIDSAIKAKQKLKGVLWEQITLPLLAKKYNIDLLFCPANSAPLYSTKPYVIHIHDACFRVNPKWYSLKFRLWYRFMIPRVIKKAKRVTTNSNHSRNDLMKFYDIPLSKMSLLYWGVDNSFIESKNLAHPLAGEDFLLYVGSIEPRKNLKTLINAFKDLKQQKPFQTLKLVIVGGKNIIFAKTELKETANDPSILIEGFLPEEQLLAYYRHAKILIYPSLYEGFGLPPLEAMASETPVIAANNSSLPEVIGDAGILIDTVNRSTLSTAIKTLLLDQNLYKELVSKGLKRVQGFNWFRSGREMLSVFYEVYQREKNKDLLSFTDHTIPIEKWQQLLKQEQTWLEEKFSSYRKIKDERGMQVLGEPGVKRIET